MKILRRTLPFVALFLSPLLVTFVMRILSFIDTYGQMTEISLIPVGTALGSSTVDLRSADGYLGRASLSADARILATNIHVIKKYCESLPQSSCDGQKLVLSQLSKPDLRLPIKVKASTCFELLDICLFSLDESEMLDSANDQARESTPARSSSEPKIYSLSNPSIREKIPVKVMQGSLLFNSRTIGIASLYSKKGMSGSPIIDDSSDLLGVATSNVDDYPVVFAFFNQLIQKISHPTYKEITFFVPQKSLDDLAACLDSPEEDCHLVQRSLFLSFLDDYKSALQSAQVSSRLRKALQIRMKEKIDLSCNQKAANTEFQFKKECQKAAEFMSATFD